MSDSHHYQEENRPGNDQMVKPPVNESTNVDYANEFFVGAFSESLEEKLKNLRHLMMPNFPTLDIKPRKQADFSFMEPSNELQKILDNLRSEDGNKSVTTSTTQNNTSSEINNSVDVDNSTENRDMNTLYSDHLLKPQSTSEFDQQQDRGTDPKFLVRCQTSTTLPFPQDLTMSDTNHLQKENSPGQEQMAKSPVNESTNVDYGDEWFVGAFSESLEEKLKSLKHLMVPDLLKYSLLRPKKQADFRYELKKIQENKSVTTSTTQNNKISEINNSVGVDNSTENRNMNTLIYSEQLLKPQSTSAFYQQQDRETDPKYFTPAAFSDSSPVIDSALLNEECMYVPPLKRAKVNSQK